MATILSAFSRDANRVPITTNGIVASKAITYVAATTGATGATTLFTVTGTVAVRVFGVVSGADLTGNGTLEVGVAGGTALILAQTTGTDLDVGQVWIDTGPALVEVLPSPLIVAGKDIIQTIGTDTITAGTITYYCAWTPLSDDGNVVAA
jgi:hypothetical protein